MIKMKFIFAIAMLLGTLDLRASDGPHYIAEIDKVREESIRVRVYLHEEGSVRARISMRVSKAPLENGSEVEIGIDRFLLDGRADFFEHWIKPPHILDGLRIGRTDNSISFVDWMLPPTHKYGNAQTIRDALNAAFPELGIQDKVSGDPDLEEFYEFLNKCARGEGMSRHFPSNHYNLSQFPSSYRKLM